MTVKSSFWSFPPSSSNLNYFFYLLSLLDSRSGAGSLEGRRVAGLAADVAKDAVQDLPGGIPQEHQGCQGGAGHKMFTFFF